MVIARTEQIRKTAVIPSSNILCHAVLKFKQGFGRLTFKNDTEGL
jgi:hypothetical protein